jgi:hypothetical protein
MDAALGVLVILVLVLVALTALARRMFGYFSDYGTVRFPRARVTTMTFAPGDLILFNSSTHGFTNSAVTRDFYSHAGMVVKHPDTGRLFLSDSSGSEVFPDADGVEYTTEAESTYLPLYTRLKYYSGETYHLRLKPALSQSQVTKLWNLVQARVPYPGILASTAGLLRLPSRGISRHCMAHVAWLVDMLELTPTDLSSRGSTLEGTGFIGVCKQVTLLPGRALGPAGGSMYAAPVHILYDIDAMSQDEWEEYTSGA